MPGSPRLAIHATLLVVLSVLTLAAWLWAPAERDDADFIYPHGFASCDVADSPQAISPLFLMGEVEQVAVTHPDLILDARIDTGATTTSLGVTNSETMERRGSTWVRFSIIDPSNGREQAFERPLVRQAYIKRHQGAAEPRPVVSLPLSVGSLCRSVEVTLANREQFQYPLLVGRNFLQGHALVDVSRRFVARGS